MSLPPLPPAVLNAELQQLGLPKENSDGVSRPYRIHRDRLRAQAAADSLRAPRLVLLERRVDAVVATSALGNLRRHMSGGGVGGIGEEGVASTASTGGGAPIGEALVSLRLGLSRLPSSLPTRVPTGDVAATPLLLAAHAAAGAAAAAAAAGAGEGGARGGAGASAAALDASKGDAALLALGIKPIGTPAAGSHSGGVLGHDGASGGGGGVGEGAGGGPRAGTPAAAYPRVRPAAFLDVTMDLSKAHALLAELRIAYSVLTKTCAALPPSSSVA